MSMVKSWYRGQSEDRPLGWNGQIMAKGVSADIAFGILCQIMAKSMGVYGEALFAFKDQLWQFDVSWMYHTFQISNLFHYFFGGGGQINPQSH